MTANGNGRYLKTADSDWYKQRLTLILFFVFAAFSLLFLRLFQLQILDGEELRRLSENNCIRLKSIDPPRGLIYDRNGHLLVDNRPAFDLSVVLKDARPVETTIGKLSDFLQVADNELMDRVKALKNKGFYKPNLLRQDIGRDALAAVEVHKFQLPGVIVDVNPRRQYIAPKSAAHLLGYLSEINGDELKCGDYPGCRQGDFIGKFGVEKTYESQLRGKRGGKQVEVDARGRVVAVMKTVDAQPGHNLFLTIDQDLQKRAETLLEGTAGAVVAMDPSTGQILAMTSSPSFDQNDFVDGMSHSQWKELSTNPFRPMENKVLQAEYPPASTYKVITAIAGLAEGVINEDSTFYCPGHYRFGNRTYRCWRKAGHGQLNVVSALEQSCDVFFYQVGQKLGVDRLAHYARSFGLGAMTGIELDHEASGLVPTAAWKKKKTGVSWQRGETLSIAIGQSYNLVTPLQMAVVTSALANGGKLFKPQIIRRIEAAEGEVIREPAPEPMGTVPVDEKTLNLVQEGLRRVVNGARGTARKIRIDGIEICGKTGTAQVFSRKKNEDNTKTPEEAHLKPHAWFIAYAPAQNPRIALSVIVEHGEHGSSAAAPIAGDLIRAYLLPNETGESLTAENATFSGEVAAGSLATTPDQGQPGEQKKRAGEHVN